MSIGIYESNGEELWNDPSPLLSYIPILIVVAVIISVVVLIRRRRSKKKDFEDALEEEFEEK